MSVQRAGTDIGASRELGVFSLVDAFPGMVPSVFIMNYVQAHHLDLDFYDRFFQPGAYLRTRAEHVPRWHTGQQGG
jgi:hypothetical protein